MWDFFLILLNLFNFSFMTLGFSMMMSTWLPYSDTIKIFSQFLDKFVISYFAFKSLMYLKYILV